MPIPFLSRIVFSLIVVVACVGTAPASAKAQPSGQKIEALSLSQHSLLLGDVETLICPLGVKCVSTRKTFTMICAAPDWKVFLYNDRDRRMFTCSLNDFRMQFNTAAAYIVGADVSFQKLAAVGRVVKHGIALRRYSYQALDRHRAAKLEEVHQVDCLVYEGPVAPSKAAQIFARLFAVSPLVKGATFELRALKGDYSEFEALQTYGVQKKQLSRADFQPPGKYKKASQVEIMQSGGLNVNDVLEQFR